MSRPCMFMKPESQNLPIVSPDHQNLQIVPLHQQPQQQNDPAQILEELGNLASAIDEFKTQFDDLQSHFDFIKKAIDIRSDLTESTTKYSIALSAKSEIVSLCESMCGKGLRRYVISNLWDEVKLREEVPSAIRRAPKPAKLVLDCVGRFYLQGSKAYTMRSPMVIGREASVLVLELYLSIMENEVQIEGDVKHEAEQAAVAWRKRIISEGGLGIANEIDARGLLLFIACYGIPKLFKNEDVWNLVLVSDLQRIGEALRKSPTFIARISGILKEMMKNGMKLEAVDVAQRLGIEDKFPPQKLLTSLMRDSKEVWKRRRRDANNSPFLLKEANEKHLAGLKSIKKFLEDRKLDPSKILPGWQFKETIVKLEKEIADLNRKIDENALAKRRADENDFSVNLNNQKTKRQRFSGKVTPLSSSPVIALRDQRMISHVDGQSSYGVYNYTVTTPDFYGSRGSSVSEIDHGPTGIGVAHATGGGLLPLYGHGPTSSSYAGIAGEIAVDRAGHTSNHGQPYSWRGVESSALSDRSLSQSLAQHPSSSTFLLSPSIEGFAGLPNSPLRAAGVRSSTSDLYRFADAIAEEYNSGARITDHQHHLLGTHNLSYKH